MELGLSGRTAVITGGSKGIGRAIARGLASQGVKLVLIARNAETLEKTAEDIRKESGVAVVAARADITSTEQVDAAAKAAKEAFGTVHIVVNNAGGPMRRMDRQILWPDSDWIGDLDNKILGALRVTRAFPPAHAGRRHGPHHQHQRHGVHDRVGAGAHACAEQRRDESGDRLPGDRSCKPADHGQHGRAGPGRHRRA